MKGIRTISLCAGVAMLILVLGFLLQPQWRTGRPVVEPLSLTSENEAAQAGERIWIDTDAACGASARTDPDDCFAVAWLAAKGFDIVGISTSFGNASGEVVFVTATSLVTALARESSSAIPVFRGSPTALSSTAGDPSAGSAALRRALEQAPLTILALGPLTNVAEALRGRPDLQAKVTRLIAVMGHQPGHLFHPTEGQGNGAILGHGPIFSDLNFSADPGAARETLAMSLRMTLIPYDAARDVLIGRSDLEALKAQGPVFADIAESARGWLEFWTDDVGLPGFYPFDWVAAGYVADPRQFGCAEIMAWTAREWTFWLIPRDSLLVGSAELAPPKGATDITYCPRAGALVHTQLMSAY